MVVRVLSPLRGGPFGAEDQGTDDLIASLDRIHAVPLELGTLRYGVHESPFTTLCFWNVGYVSHSRRPVTGEQTADIVGENSQRGQIWLLPHICSGNRGEVCG